MFVRRFLQTTQAKQLDVEKNAHIATGVTGRINTVHTTKNNRHNRKLAQKKRLSCFPVQNTNSKKRKQTKLNRLN